MYTDVNHCAFIQRSHDQIISASIEPSVIIPCSMKISKNIREWNKYIMDHLDTSLFWHFLWKQSGSPRPVTVADIMRSTQARYHSAIRFVKKHELQLRNSAMARAVTENCNRDFWKEVYKRRNKVTTDSMDDVLGNNNISRLFAENVNCYTTLLSIRMMNVINLFMITHAMLLMNVFTQITITRHSQ